MAKEILSAEDFRTKLYHSLREKGLVDALQTQLRNKLVSELKTQGVGQSVYFAPPPTTDNSLLLKAANSLVADHMSKCKYDYSLSVFVPESGNSADKLFTMRELMQLLRISQESKLAKTLLSHSAQYNKRGFLWQLLIEIAHCHGYGRHESSCQTDPVALPGINSIEEEFAKLDRKYAELSDDFKSKMVIEERLLSYQRQLDERSRTEIQLECARFKDNELARMRLEERENARREIDKARKEMERTYKAKYELLTEKERHATEKLQKAQEMHDAETYQQRQSVLDELEVLRQRETSLRRQEEMNKREQQLWDEKTKSREAQAKRKEEAARRLEVEYEQKIRDEVSKFKIEEQSRYLEWNKSLEIREARVKENERRIDEELHDLKQVKDELREKRDRCQKLEVELTRTRHDMISYEKKAELLSQKAQQMLDYEVVREQNAVLKKELEVLNQRVAELIRDNIVERTKSEDLLREMGALNTKPTSETYLVRKQLEKLHADMRQERAVADHDRAQIERRLQDEMERNSELMRKLEEQTRQQRDLLDQLKDNRQSLVHHRVALDNEVYRNNRHSFLSRSGSLCDYEDKDATASPAAPTHPQTRQHRDNQLVFEALERSVGGGEEGDYSYSSDVVRETRARLRGLEREAQDLQEHYRNFQTRLSVPALGMSADPATVILGTPERAPPTSYTPASKLTRPASSTPSRPTSTVRVGGTAGSAFTHELNNSMSTIRSGSPVLDRPSMSPVVRHRPMSVNDLEARPGSPPVVVMPTSEASASHHGVGRTGGTSATHPRGGRVSPSGEEGTTESKTEGNAPTLSMDDARQRATQATTAAAAAPSLDDAWRQQQDADRRRREVQEAEDRRYEEERRQREEERRRREEEAWEREQRALRELQGQSGAPERKQEERQEEPRDSGAPQIDPVMAKYMQMVTEQKQKEKKTAKKTLDTWMKGRSQERTESASEEQISAGGVDTEDERSQGPATVGDFW